MVELDIIKSHISGKDRGWLVTHPEFELTEDEQKKYDVYITRYESGEPLPYILGYKEFYGRRFTVNKHTLIPRPESELIIDEAKKIASSIQHPTIIDVGTGSGCLAITAALEIPHAHIHATDISAEALTVAQKNAKNLTAKVTFHKGNLLELSSRSPTGSTPLETWIPYDYGMTIVLANLPYIPTDEWKTLDPRVKNHEPQKALDGGRDGLDYYKKLLQQLPDKKIHLLCEIMPDQATHLINEIKKVRPNAHTEIMKDLAGLQRLVVSTFNTSLN